nr:MAG: putative RNA-dependent RNA polymerase [Barnaviridae sp.]
MNSSPGVPYTSLGATNKVLFESPANRGLIFSAVVERLRRILSTDLDELMRMSSGEMVRAGLTDPIKVFVKSEPHKVSKIRDGKLRIISNVSIVDQLIERVLCSKQNQAEIRRWCELPSKPGMGLHDEGLQELYMEVNDRMREHTVVGTDISGWDWLVKLWMLLSDARIRVQLYDTDENSALGHCLMFRGWAVANKVFCLSDGSLLEQTVPGIQASGSYNTSSTNSRMRALLAFIIGCIWVIVMGDDGVEDYVPGARERYERMGFVVKDYEIFAPGSFEFCSTRFDGDWRGKPIQWLRTVYRYLSHSPASHSQNPGFKAQLLDDLRHLPEGQEILDKCDSIVELESKPCH